MAQLSAEAPPAQLRAEGAVRAPPVVGRAPDASGLLFFSGAEASTPATPTSHAATVQRAGRGPGYGGAFGVENGASGVCATAPQAPSVMTTATALDASMPAHGSAFTTLDSTAVYQALMWYVRAPTALPR
jgi:hypothetical protein